MSGTQLQAIQERPGNKTLRMSFEEYLDWLEEDVRAEWVDGEVIKIKPVTWVHQLCANFIFKLIDYWASENNLGVANTAPFPIRLTLSDNEVRGREPDILFVAKTNLDRLKETYFDGAPDLIVEVISKESRQRNRGEKFYEYEASGVKEYWLIDYQRKKAEFYQLQPDGTYEMIGTENDVYRSKVLPGFWLKVGWLWQDPFPRMQDILKEWGLI